MEWPSKTRLAISFHHFKDGNKPVYRPNSERSIVDPEELRGEGAEVKDGAKDVTSVIEIEDEDRTGGRGSSDESIGRRERDVADACLRE